MNQVANRFASQQNEWIWMLCFQTTFHKSIDRNCDVLPVEYDIFRSLIDVGVKFGLRKIIHEVK